MPYFYDITNVPPLVPDSRSNSVKTTRQMMHIVELIPRLIGETSRAERETFAWFVNQRTRRDVARVRKISLEKIAR